MKTRMNLILIVTFLFMSALPSCAKKSDNGISNFTKTETIPATTASTPSEKETPDSVQVMAEKEKNLETVGLKFKNSNAATPNNLNLAWDAEFLENFFKIHPELTEKEMMIELLSFIEAGEKAAAEKIAAATQSALTKDQLELNQKLKEKLTLAKHLYQELQTL